APIQKTRSQDRVFLCLVFLQTTSFRPSPRLTGAEHRIYTLASDLDPTPYEDLAPLRHLSAGCQRPDPRSILGRAPQLWLISQSHEPEFRLGPRGLCFCHRPAKP